MVWFHNKTWGIDWHRVLIFYKQNHANAQDGLACTFRGLIKEPLICYPSITHEPSFECCFISCLLGIIYQMALRLTDTKWETELDNPTSPVFKDLVEQLTAGVSINHIALRASALGDSSRR